MRHAAFIGTQYGYGTDSLEIVIGVHERDVGGISRDVGGRPVQFGEVPLIHGAASTHRRGLWKESAIPDHRGLDTRIAGRLDRLNSAAGVTHDRDPVRGEMAPKCTAAARVLLLRPVDGLQQLRGMRRGRWQICKPWRRSGAWQGPRRQW